MLFSVPHKSSVPYQFLVRGRSGTACCSQDWGHRMRHIHGFPSGNILLTTKLLSHDPLSWDIDSLLTLWPLLIPCSLDNGCCTFGFLIFIHCQKKFLVQQPMYTHKRIIKTPMLHQTWVPVSFFLSRSLSLSLPPANSLERGNLPRLSSPPQEGALCLRERYKPCPRALLVLCLTQGILASWSLSLSYRRLRTTRF